MFLLALGIVTIAGCGSIGSSSSKVKTCEISEDCKPGFRCTEGICTDIHHPFLGAQPADKVKIK